MEEMIPNSIDGVHISIVDNVRQIDLPMTMNGEQFGRWKRYRGGVFFRDLYLWNKGDEYGNYVLLEGENKKLILRLITDEEYEDFKERKLVQGKLIDKYYMELKNLSVNEESDQKLGYTDEKDEDIISEDSMSIKPTNIPLQDDEEAGSSKSVSLFND